jgi:hypothetical protein
MDVSTTPFEVYSFEEKVSYLSKITTRKRGTIRASFLDLCELFGTPHAPFDGKVQAEWTLRFNPTDDRMSVVVDIYDWKCDASVYEVAEWVVASDGYDGLELVEGLLAQD